MFYLKQFFKVVFSNPVSGISFCVLTISLTIFIGHNDLFLGKILNVYRPSHPDPYFFALITSNDDVSEVARKLARLPGIKDVKVEDEVVILGEQGKQKITTEQIAEKMDSINYEVTTKINPFLPRVIK